MCFCSYNMAKESYQKGMTKKEVYSKLDGLKTEVGKAKYLDKILSKKGLLAPETYKAVQESADEVYGKASVEAVERGRFEDAGEFAEKAKNKKLAEKIYGKVADIYEERGEFIKAKELRKRLERRQKKK